MDNPILIFVCAILGPVAMYYLWTRADKIRASRLWFAGAIAWIYASAYTVGAWLSILNGVGVQLPAEEIAMPFFIAMMFVVLMIVGYFHIYRPYRKIKKGIY